MKQNTLQGVVPITYVQLLYDYLATQNIHAESLLGPLPAAENGLGRFPVSQWRDLLERSSNALNDPLLGLHLGATISPKHLGVLGYVLLACGTLGAALQRLERYHQLIYDVNPLRISVEGNHVALTWGQEMGRPGPLVDETAIAALIHFCRDITNQPKLNPHSVDFINAHPNNLSAYENWFGCPSRFEQNETRILISATALQTPLRSADPALIDILQKQADDLLANLPRQTQQQTTNAVRRHITQQLHISEPNADQTAQLLHVTSRTLHRRLSAEGNSFRGILQQTREQLAKNYLQDPRLQLAEIAQLLGYSEQSAFSRAFKDWCQQTPNQYRQQQLAVYSPS